MLSNTVELIIQASSNFHFIFCFCNLIILFVLIAEGSKYRTRYVAESVSASSLSSPVEYNSETSNALSIRGDDHDYDDDEHNSVKSEPSFDSQDGIPNKGTSDDHNMTNQEVGGDDDGEATFEEQGQASADSTKVGSKESQIYAALSPVNGDVKATLEDQKQNQEEEEEDGGGDDDDELRRKIEDFIDKVNKEWREEKEKLVHFE